MMSRKTYSCFVCQKNGFDDVQVFLAGKTEDGKTVYLEPDGVTKHIHKEKQSPVAEQQSSVVAEQSQQPTEAVVAAEDKSVQKGISAFSMVTNLIILMEQTQKLLASMNEKLDRLLNLAERK